MKKSILFSIMIMLVAGVFFTSCGQKLNPETKKAAETILQNQKKAIDELKNMPIDPTNPQLAQMVADKEAKFADIAKTWDEAKYKTDIDAKELEGLAKQKKDNEDLFKKTVGEVKAKIAQAAAAPAPDAAAAAPAPEAKK